MSFGPAAGDLFRKKALDKLSSPEQLDVMMQVTSPAGWIALAGVGVVLAFVTVWSIVGQIGVKVEGQGILIRGASLLDVTSSDSGRLSEILVKPGDTIQVGQVVARMDQSDLQLKIDNTKAQIAQLEAQKLQAGAGSAGIIAQYRAQAAELREKVVQQERLVRRGLLTNSTLMRTKEQLTGVESQIQQLQMGRSGDQIQVDNLKRQLSEYQARLASSSDLKSPYGGRVVEVSGSTGALLNAGSPLLTLEPLDAPLECLLYVPATDGKKVRPGMDVRVSPSTVKQEEFGFMIAKVKSVSDFPVSPEGLRKRLRNDRLAEQLAGKGAPLEVVAELQPDKDTPSGFKWSSSKGPPTQVYSGTQTTGSVVVETKTPISYVLPVVKKSLGMS